MHNYTFNFVSTVSIRGYSQMAALKNIRKFDFLSTSVKLSSHLSLKQTPLNLFCYNPNCVLKFLDQFRRNALKNQFKKRKNPSKRCTKSILLKFFNTTLRRIRVVLTRKINLFSLTFAFVTRVTKT